MAAISTIIPIFAIVALGAIVRRKGFIPQTFLEPANRLVYYLAIPAMIFRAIARSTSMANLNPALVFITLGCVLAGFAAALLANQLTGLRRRQSGTFIQCAFHGNLGYIGLAVIFYYLGEKGLVSGSILAGFIMILQNLLAVIALQLFSSQNPSKFRLQDVTNRILINPVILSALAGIAYSLTGKPLPLILDRSLSILSGLALPTALLLIGASLSFSLMRKYLTIALLSSFFKLALLPALGAILYLRFGLRPEQYLPGLILLSAPPATLTYIFAKEMDGDSELAVAAISVGTILSGVAYTAWLSMMG